MISNASASLNNFGDKTLLATGPNAATVCPLSSVHQSSVQLNVMIFLKAWKAISELQKSKSNVHCHQHFACARHCAK